MPKLPRSEDTAPQDDGSRALDRMAANIRFLRAWGLLRMKEDDNASPERQAELTHTWERTMSYFARRGMLRTYTPAQSRHDGRSTMHVLRWVVALPAGLALGYLSYFVGGFINNTATALAMGPPQGWVVFALDFMANMYLGAGLMYGTVRIAPAHPRRVASATAGLVLLVSGASVWSAIAIGKYTAIVSVLGVLWGGCAVLVGAWTGHIQPFRPREDTAPTLPPS
jgi:hypothetical protein